MPRRLYSGIVGRRIIDPLVLAGEISRQRRAVLQSSKRLELATIPSGFLRSRGGVLAAETLFILGSGESVLGLSEQNWNEVRNGVSIGIGAWTIHPFVPDFLALEHINPNPEFGLASQDETLVEYSYRKALEGWHLRQDVQAIDPQVLLFRPPSGFPATRLQPLGDFGRRNSWIYGRVGSSAGTRAELRSEVERYFRWASLSLVPHYLPFDTGATVTRLISLGIRAGFTEIALVGIDLRDSRYFWDVNPELLSLRGLKNFVTIETVAQHSTEAGKALPMSDVLDLLGSFMSERYGIGLYAGHRSSWLANVLPTYTWT